MPYTEAFIMELLRMAPVLPVGVLHRTMDDIEFHGYFIPKGTTVLANLYSTHHDPEVFPNPESFRPERFLSEDGKSLGRKNESLIPFSIGKRVCLGEAFARDQLFLFITSLVQQFRITADPGTPQPSLEGILGKLTLQPQPYSVIMKERI